MSAPAISASTLDPLGERSLSRELTEVRAQAEAEHPSLAIELVLKHKKATQTYF